MAWQASWSHFCDFTWQFLKADTGGTFICSFCGSSVNVWSVEVFLKNSQQLVSGWMEKFNVEDAQDR